MTPLVQAEAIERRFRGSRTLRDVVARRRPTVRAVDGVDLTIGKGESVGLVGESGSGKTTIGRLLLALDRPTAGQIRFDGEMLGAVDLRRFRARAQLVFQNPYDALNPRLTIGRSLVEPLRSLGVPKPEHADRVAEALRLVRLQVPLDAYPHQLSGGQLQRTVLARALVPGPEFLVADEPVSMLDVSVRAGVLNLMRDLRARLNLAALYISHDLTLVRYVCERTVVLYLGKVVEDGPTSEVITRPAHPYTQALIAAVPRPSVHQPRGPLPLSGAIGDSANPLSGCRLRDRCPYAFAQCAEEVPALAEVAPGHRAACHLHSVVEPRASPSPAGGRGQG